MKTIIITLLLAIHCSAFSQNGLFNLYTDSASFVQDASSIASSFTKSVNSIQPIFKEVPKPVINTQVYLISYSPNTNKVNLPLWYQVIEPQKQFFMELNGSEEKGKKMFGLFFNGFYLAHELGHAVQVAVNKLGKDNYKNEYEANIMGILYWRKIGKERELKQCYNFALSMVKQLPNPVPEGMDPVQYFNDNYDALGAEPKKYGYYQWAQFVKIYEDKSLKDFDGFVADFLK